MVKKNFPVHSAAGPLAIQNPHRILIADDNQDAADSLAMLLELLGYQVLTVYGGNHAIEVAQQQRPDTVVLDIGMPGLNGYDVARRLRELEWAQELTLIAHTGYGQIADVRRARAAGFDHHLTKPLEFELLRRILRGELPPLAGCRALLN